MEKKQRLFAKNVCKARTGKAVVIFYRPSTCKEQIGDVQKK